MTTAAHTPAERPTAASEAADAFRAGARAPPFAAATRPQPPYRRAELELDPPELVLHDVSLKGVAAYHEVFITFALDGEYAPLVADTAAARAAAAAAGGVALGRDESVQAHNRSTSRTPLL